MADNTQIPQENLNPPSWISQPVPNNNSAPIPANPNPDVANAIPSSGFTQVLQNIKSSPQQPSKPQIATGEDLGQKEFVNQVLQTASHHTNSGAIFPQVSQAQAAKGQNSSTIITPLVTTSTNVPMQATASYPEVPPPVFTNTVSQFSPAQATSQQAMDGFKPKRKKKTLLLVLILFLIMILGALGAAWFLYISPNLYPKDPVPDKEPTSTAKITLEYWGLWESEAVMQDVISAYEAEHPDIHINYKLETIKDYRQRVVTAIENGNGPDIFRFHNSWKPMIKSVLQPDSKKLINSADYYPTVKRDMTIGGEVFAVPLGFDTLVLYYNVEKLQSIGKANPPSNWEDVKQYGKALTIKDKNGSLQIGGMAMGSVTNVDYWSDIVGLLLLQSGVNPSKTLDPTAMQFFIQFGNSSAKTWDSTLPPSTQAFATGKAAMMIAPSSVAQEIKKTNPDLDFRTAPVPQLTDKPVNWATYWLEGVSRKSKHSQAAWEFLAYLSQDENLQKLYTATIKSAPERTIGQPYPKMRLGDTIKDDLLAGAVIAQASNAQYWYLCANTDDNGLNDFMISYFESAINQIVDKGDIVKVLETLNTRIKDLLSKYDMTSS